MSCASDRAWQESREIALCARDDDAAALAARGLRSETVQSKAVDATDNMGASINAYIIFLGGVLIINIIL